jgi:YidC/Oxa1 family membrane protein insertase
VNKNTILAFSLIILTILFFNSPLYNKTYEKLFHNSRNSNQINNEKEETKENNIKETNEVKKTIINNENRQLSAIAQQSDSNKQLVNKDTIGDTIWVENEKILCGITEIGAKIISIKMKEYFYSKKNDDTNSLKRNIEIVSNSELGGGNLEINGIKFDSKKFKIYILDKNIKVSKSEKKYLTFSYIDEGKNELIKRYAFEGDSYKIGYEIISKSLDGKSIVVGWKGGINESENNNIKQSSMSGVNEPRKVHFYDSKNVGHIQLKKVEKEEETGFYKWAAITSKYFMVAMVAESVKNTDLLIESNDITSIDNEGKRGSLELNYGIQMRRSGEGSKESFWIYAGPSKYTIIRSFNEKFQKVLFSGWEWLLRADLWFPIICEWTLWLLIGINGFIKDYGISIIILTILTRIITFPLSQSSMKSMSRMKDIQPKINHIRERYKTNPKKMNEEIMTLYKKEGVNPFNPGCLPMFLQMPILFALFIVLRKAIELRGAGTILLPWIKDLAQPEALISLTGIFPNGIPIYGSNIALLPILMAILTYFQNKMTIKDPNQKMMIYFMPPFMLVLFNNFPAGLVLYWTFSNALGILQQYMLEKGLKSKQSSQQAPVLLETRKTGRRNK